MSFFSSIQQMVSGAGDSIASLGIGNSARNLLGGGAGSINLGGLNSNDDQEPQVQQLQNQRQTSGYLRPTGSRYGGPLVVPGKLDSPASPAPYESWGSKSAAASASNFGARFFGPTSLSDSLESTSSSNLSALASKLKLVTTQDAGPVESAVRRARSWRCNQSTNSSRNQKECEIPTSSGGALAVGSDLNRFRSTSRIRSNGSFKSHRRWSNNDVRVVGLPSESYLSRFTSTSSSSKRRRPQKDNALLSPRSRSFAKMPQMWAEVSETRSGYVIRYRKC